MDILYSILTLTGLGVFFAVVLAYASKKLAVASDETLQAVINRLPGFNCGACGQAGCAGFAQALLKGDIDLLKCSVMKEIDRKAITDILKSG